MVRKWLLVVFLVQSLICEVFSGVPVLLWESSSISRREDVVPALDQLNSDDFSNHIVKKVHGQKPLVVVFLEESLSVEDFSWIDDQRRGSFPQLQNVTKLAEKVEFLTSVEDPMDALRDLSSQGYTLRKLDVSKLPAKEPALLQMDMSDPLVNEDRPDMLRRHDVDIAEVYSQLLAKHSHIVAILTGKQSAWVEPSLNRIRRAAEEAEESNSTAPGSFFYNADGQALIFSSSFPKIEDGEKVIPLTKYFAVQPDIRNNLMRVTVGHQTPEKILLRYRFEKQGNNWNLANVEYERGDTNLLLTPTRKISGNINRSFSTKNKIEFVNGTTKLVFDDLKVQPWTKTNEFSAVSESSDATFFTIPIWSGIFVSAILGLILLWGITMLMDIRTMDRFDDPKGKTISVNAAD